MPLLQSSTWAIDCRFSQNQQIVQLQAKADPFPCGPPNWQDKMAPMLCSRQQTLSSNFLIEPMPAAEVVSSRSRTEQTMASKAGIVIAASQKPGQWPLVEAVAFNCGAYRGQRHEIRGCGSQSRQKGFKFPASCGRYGCQRGHGVTVLSDW